jgi:nicotinamidase-related amidase
MIQFDSSPALIVVDMQNGFCHKDGSFARLGIQTDPTTIVARITRPTTRIDAVAIDRIDSNNSKVFYGSLGMRIF